MDKIRKMLLPVAFIWPFLVLGSELALEYITGWGPEWLALLAILLSLLGIPVLARYFYNLVPDTWSFPARVIAAGLAAVVVGGTLMYLALVMFAVGWVHLGHDGA